MARIQTYRLTASQQDRYGLSEVGFVNVYRGDGWVPNQSRYGRAAGALTHYFKTPATAQGWHRQLTSLVQSALARRVHYREILAELALLAQDQSAVTQVRHDQLSWLFLAEEEKAVLPARQLAVAAHYTGVRDRDKIKAKLQLSKSIGLIGGPKWRNPSASLACLVAADAAMVRRRSRIIQSIMPSHYTREPWVAGLALDHDGAMTRAVKYLLESEAVTIHDFRPKLEPIFLQPANRWSNYACYLLYRYGNRLEGEVKDWAVEAAYFETRLENHMLAPFDKTAGDTLDKFERRRPGYLAKLLDEMAERFVVLRALAPMGPAYDSLFQRLEDEYGEIVAGFEAGNLAAVWQGCHRLGLVWRLRSLAPEPVRAEWFGYTAGVE